MNQVTDDFLHIAEPIAHARATNQPVVTLESTVIAHGLPLPLNLETAQACEAVIQDEGAQSATLGVVAGRLTVGLSTDELQSFANGRAPDGQTIEKVSLNNLAGVISQRGWGATTVAASLHIARFVGLRVFATGGIGGVHRGAETSFDISADLMALARHPVICVCAGAKAILDLPKTVEVLETLGVPVVGFGTDELPAFYSRRSGFGVDVRVETADEAAQLAWRHWQTVGQTAVLVCVPVPEEFEIPASDIARAIAEAQTDADRQALRGKALTPFLLSRLKELTSGRTLAANRALLINNARVAAQISVQLQALTES